MTIATTMHRRAWAVAVAVTLLVLTGCARGQNAVLSAAHAAETGKSASGSGLGAGDWSKTTKPGWML